MKRKLPRLAIGLTLATIVTTAPAWSVSQSAMGPAQPVPELAVPGVPSAAALPVSETFSPGSAALVPLVAADLPATNSSTVEASEPTAGGDIGKPIDDIAFLARATEDARRDMAAARDAVPQLQDPALKRLAEALAEGHSEANARMARLAESKMWPVPPASHDLPPAGTASPDFDANWTDDMISAHEQSVALYSAQAQGGEDRELRQYARDTLSTIQRHLAELRRLQK